MITTQSADLAEKLRRLRDHGAAMSDLQRHLGARPYLLADHPDAGYNQRMTDLQAALGAAQMDRAADIIAELKRLAKTYDTAFADLSWLRTPAHVEGLEHGYQSYPCLFQPEPVNADSIGRINAVRNAWMDSLQQSGISTRPATHAVHMLAFYREKYELKPSDFPNAWAANDCSISLPIFHGMTEAEQQHVIQNVLEYSA
jgi:dTDP-4-amino-4,6-dideoxygalactose transaminase